MRTVTDKGNTRGKQELTIPCTIESCFTAKHSEKAVLC
jgi:hypothetical protein